MQILTKQASFKSMLAKGNCAFNPQGLRERGDLNEQQLEAQLFGADCQLDKVTYFGIPVLKHIRTRLLKAVSEGQLSTGIRGVFDSALSDVEESTAKGLGTQSSKLTEKNLGMASDTSSDSQSLAELQSDLVLSMSEASELGHPFLIFCLVAAIICFLATACHRINMGCKSHPCGDFCSTLGYTCR